MKIYFSESVQNLICKINNATGNLDEYFNKTGNILTCIECEYVANSPLNIVTIKDPDDAFTSRLWIPSYLVITVTD